jgi:hypothetical protein
MNRSNNRTNFDIAQKKRPLPAEAERGYPKNRYNLCNGAKREIYFFIAPFRSWLFFTLFLHVQRYGHFVRAVIELLELLERNIVGVV